MWELTDHICRVCLGRVLRRKVPGGWVNRCADCGLEAAGKVEALCCCGAKLKTGKNAGFRCRPNPDGPSPESPAEIVALFVGLEPVRHAPANLRDDGPGLFDDGEDENG